MVKHLLLCSEGLGAVAEFLETRLQPHVERPVVAMLVVGDEPGTSADAAELTALGCELREVRLGELAGDRLDGALSGAQVLFAPGGDARQLLHELRRSGLADRLPGLLDAGVVYIGVGSGATVMGRDVAPLALFTEVEDSPELASTEGLGYVAVVPISHSATEGDELVERARTRYGREFHLEFLAPDQAIVVEDDVAAVIESPIAADR